MANQIFERQSQQGFHLRRPPVITNSHQGIGNEGKLRRIGFGASRELGGEPHPDGVLGKFFTSPACHHRGRQAGRGVKGGKLSVPDGMGERHPRGGSMASQRGMQDSMGNTGRESTHPSQAASLCEGAPAVALEMLKRPANFPHLVKKKRDRKRGEQMPQKIRPLLVRVEARVGVPVFRRTNPLVRIRPHPRHCGDDGQVVRMDSGQHAAASFQDEEDSGAASFETGEIRSAEGCGQGMAVLSEAITANMAGCPSATI